MAEEAGQLERTSKAHAGSLILTAVSWAAKKGYIAHAHLAGQIDLPPPVLRGWEARMDDELMDLLIAESAMNQHKPKEFGSSSGRFALR